MADYNPGDLILYKNQSYAIVEKVIEDGTYELRAGSRFIQNVPSEQIERVKVNPRILKSAGFTKDPDKDDIWLYAGNGVRMNTKVENESEFEITIMFQNRDQVGSTIYFLDYFDQLQELYKKAFNTDLPTNFSYTQPLE